MRNKRTDQLRVRLTPEEKNSIEYLIRTRGRGETISDIIREMLAAWISPDGGRPVVLDEPAAKQLDELSDLLRRSPSQVAADCIAGIRDQIVEDNDRSPLIVEEARLRSRYSEAK